MWHDLIIAPIPHIRSASSSTMKETRARLVLPCRGNTRIRLGHTPSAAAVLLPCCIGVGDWVCA